VLTGSQDSCETHRELCSTQAYAAQNSWLTEPTLALVFAGSRLLWMLGRTPPGSDYSTGQGRWQGQDRWCQQMSHSSSMRHIDGNMQC
jgi:hypothetical protein